MGIFRKIKDNLKHGGVKVEFISPNQIEKDAVDVPIEITLIGGDISRQIKSVTASIERYYFSNSSNDTTPHEDILASQTYTTPFELPMGQNFKLTLTIPLSDPSLNPVINKAAQVVNAASKLANFANSQGYQHFVKVRADVEGIANDPTKKVRVILDGHEQSNIQFSPI
jgi:hypothetical protein